jgi:small subunit ribosomal protein S14
MKKFVQKDKNRRKINFEYERDRLALSTISSNQNLPLAVRWKARLALGSISKNSFSSKLNNRCGLTGRSRSVLRDFKLSRIAFRKASNSGLIPGLKKFSW